MNVVSLLRDPVWQGVGAVIAAIGVVITVILMPDVRGWIYKRTLRLKRRLFERFEVRALLLALLFLASVPGLNQIHGEVVSLVAVGALSLSVAMGFDNTRPGVIAVVVLGLFVVTYVSLGILAIDALGQSAITHVFYSYQFQLASFVVMLYFTLQPVLANHDQCLTNLDLRAVQMRQQLARLDTQGVTPTPRPQWSNFIDHVKRADLSFDCESRHGRRYSHYEETARLSYYEIVVRCGWAVNRESYRLKIAFPTDLIEPCDDDKLYERKVVYDILFEASKVFVGYDVDYQMGDFES
jgi:hypothetical protein